MKRRRSQESCNSQGLQPCMCIARLECHFFSLQKHPTHTVSKAVTFFPFFPSCKSPPLRRIRGNERSLCNRNEKKKEKGKKEKTKIFSITPGRFVYSVSLMQIGVIRLHYYISSRVPPPPRAAPGRAGKIDADGAQSIHSQLCFFFFFFLSS